MSCRILLTNHRTGPETNTPDWSAAFASPVRTREAHRLREVLPLLAAAEANALAGAWVVFFLSYEAAPAFEPGMAAHPPASIAPLPLAWAATFAAPLPPVTPSPVTLSPGWPLASGHWEPQVDAATYRTRFQHIKTLLQAGEVYQINYTLPFLCPAPADTLAWHRQLLAAQQPGFGAWLDLGAVQILSCSPELFFHRRGDRLLTRPMKGTAPRGQTPADDAALAAALAASPKERAENIMIVDLLRNDLGRLAWPGGVRVEGCCRVERYPTVLQMVSDVVADLRPGIRLPDILTALFPCGSVTGAPKLAAMRAIRELEPHPRGVYCGAIGLVKPGGETICSVPIRTIVVQAGQAACSVGGGVTWDSSEAGEYAECRLKLRFASPAFPGPPDFSLLESLLLARGALPFLEDHLHRCRRAADWFGFHLDIPAIRAGLQELAARNPQGRAKLRLLVAPDGAFHLELHPLPGQRRHTLRLALDTHPVDSADPFLRHKTTRRERYDAALARFPEAEDVLLWNARGEVTECCFGNLVLQHGRQLLTPARACGLLEGVYRSRLLARGVIREAIVTIDDLLSAQALWRINAVRRWQRCLLVPSPTEQH